MTQKKQLHQALKTIEEQRMIIQKMKQERQEMITVVKDICAGNQKIIDGSLTSRPQLSPITAKGI